MLSLCLKKSTISLNGSQIIKDWPAQLSSCVSAIKMPSLVLSFSLFRLEWILLDQGISLNLSQSLSYLKYWRRTCISSNSWENILLRSSVIWLYNVSLAVFAELEFVAVLPLQVWYGPVSCWRTCTEARLSCIPFGLTALLWQVALSVSCEAVATGAGFLHINSPCLNFTRSKLLRFQYITVLKLNFWSYSN